MKAITSDNVKISFRGVDLIVADGTQCVLTSKDFAKPLSRIIITREDDIYLHEIIDAKTNRVVSFNAMKDLSHLFKEKDNEITLNGINIFDESTNLSEINDEILATIELGKAEG